MLGVEALERVLRRAPGGRAVGSASPLSTCAAGARAQRADQGVPARPAARRGGRQHLRRRGPAPRAHPSPAARRRAHLAAVRPPARDGSRRCSKASTRAARRSMTSAMSTASAAPSRTASSCTAAPASRARFAGPRSSSWSSPGAAPTCARPASRGRGAYAPRPGALRPLGRPPGSSSSRRPFCTAACISAKPPSSSLADEDLREGHHPRLARQLRAALGILGEVDFGELQAARPQQTLDARAERARFGRVHGDLAHYFIKYRKPIPSAGPLMGRQFPALAGSSCKPRIGSTPSARAPAPARGRTRA